MMNKNIIMINESSLKKQVALTGFLVLPLRIGERAFISHGQQSIATSSVQQILEVSNDGIVFETRNTIYSLVYTTMPIETEVMCA
ncbi:MAG: hypothetical protein PHN80_13760 [Hespellia sp.]|nr:hypothetical protein [Hespellia sp.]